ncbi:sensor histidine kinase [Streptomyces incarnatus]
MPEDLRSAVFERFTRAGHLRHGDTSATGAGLGLSIVSAVVEAHGGTVEAESRAGSTTFRVTLPA